LSAVKEVDVGNQKEGLLFHPAKGGRSFIPYLKSNFFLPFKH